MFEYSKKPKILVIGDLILDQYLWGHSSRISPEAPVPVIDITSKILKRDLLKLTKKNKSILSLLSIVDKNYE